MGLLNSWEHSESWYKKKIEQLEDQVQELEEQVEYWHDCHNTDYEKINKLNSNIKTMKNILENLAPHQVPTVEIEDDYFNLLAYGIEAEAFHSIKELPYKNGDYIVLKSKDSGKTILVRIGGVKETTIGGSYSRSEDLGYRNGNMAIRDLRFTYPEATDKTKIYLYYVTIIS